MGDILENTPEGQGEGLPFPEVNVSHTVDPKPLAANPSVPQGIQVMIAPHKKKINEDAKKMAQQRKGKESKMA